jgi:hypothetical protein
MVALFTERCVTGERRAFLCCLRSLLAILTALFVIGSASFLRTASNQFGNLRSMPTVITVAEIYKQAGLTPCGPKSWGAQIPERSAGVYVVALVPDSSVRLEGPVYAEYLDKRERERWLSEQPIIYIGQTTRQTLAKRLSQFYMPPVRTAISPSRRRGRKALAVQSLGVLVSRLSSRGV